MKLELVIISVAISLTACGGGGGSSSSDGGSSSLGRCDFTVGAGNVPQVSVQVSTDDQAIGQSIRADCQRARTETARRTSCITTTPEMYPYVLRTRDNGYTIISGNTRRPNISSAQLPAEVANNVVVSWLQANNVSSFAGC